MIKKFTDESSTVESSKIISLSIATAAVSAVSAVSISQLVQSPTDNNLV